MTYKIAVVGEAWGAEEAKARAPFIGASGQELTRMLSEAGIHRADCYLTNVFNLRPENNEIETLCCPKAEAGAGASMPSLKNGKYVRAEFLPEVARLLDEVRKVRPNVIIALGNTATWAILHNTGISKIRGTVTDAPRVGSKVVPTYHPAAVLRDWSLRAVTVLDLAKAARESAFPEIRRPERTVYIEPDLADMERYFNEAILPCKILSFDIETSGDQITCIGFAPRADSALVVPFVDPRRPGSSYWSSEELERLAWNYVRRVLNIPQPKVGQNILYDIHFLWRQYGIPVKNVTEDSMLLHHALQPESQKGLGFLGSVYSNEQSWKLLGKRGLTETIKRDA